MGIRADKRYPCQIIHAGADSLFQQGWCTLAKKRNFLIFLVFPCPPPKKKSRIFLARCCLRTQQKITNSCVWSNYFTQLLWYTTVTQKLFLLNEILKITDEGLAKSEYFTTETIPRIRGQSPRFFHDFSSEINFPDYPRFSRYATTLFNYQCFHWYTCDFERVSVEKARI